MKKLADLKGGDMIFCVNFSGEKIYNADYVNINFYKKGDKDSLYTNFTTSHKTKPLGCSSALRDEDLNKHYFLSNIIDSFWFFTLKPKTWKEDLTAAMKKYELRETEKYKKQVDDKLTKIKKFIDYFDVNIYL